MHKKPLKSYLVSSLLLTGSALATELPPLQLTEQITLSGLSSGAYMASQFHIAFSENVGGAAMIAGGPLYCAQNSLATAFAHCMSNKDAKPDLAAINDYLAQLQETQQLPTLQNLRDDKVWILHGGADSTVHPHVGKALLSQYQQWVIPENLQFIGDKPFAHHFPTDNNSGTACDVSEPPFIANCQYDAAGALLQHLLGSVQPKADTTEGKLIKLTQSQAGSLLAQSGYVYIPANCAAGEACRLHISFHGCRQHVNAVGDAYITQTGLNNYADTNSLVVLYPQATASAANPHGCWDWWGYTTPDYISSQAPQLQAVKLLAERLYPQLRQRND